MGGSKVTMPALLTVKPLCDEAVGDGVFGWEPERGRVASPGRSLDLQGGADFFQAEPASVLQLCVLDT